MSGRNVTNEPSFLPYKGTMLPTTMGENAILDMQIVKLDKVRALPERIIKEIEDMSSRGLDPYEYSYLVTDLNSGLVGLVMADQILFTSTTSIIPTFKVPLTETQDNTKLGPEPLVSLVITMPYHHQTTLVSCTLSGEIRVWPDILQAGLSGYVHGYINLALALSDGEQVELMVNLQGLGVVIATTQYLYYIALVDPLRPKLVPLREEEGSVFSKVTTLFGSGAAAPIQNGVVGCAISPSSPSNPKPPRIYVLTDTTISVWQVSDNLIDEPRFIGKINLLRFINEAMQSCTQLKWHKVRYDVIDISVLSNQNLVILIELTQILSIPPKHFIALLYLSPLGGDELDYNLESVKLHEDLVVPRNNWLSAKLMVPSDMTCIVSPHQLLIYYLNQFVALPVSSGQMIEINDVMGPSQSCLAHRTAGLIRIRPGKPFTIHPDLVALWQAVTTGLSQDTVFDLTGLVQNCRDVDRLVEAMVEWAIAPPDQTSRALSSNLASLLSARSAKLYNIGKVLQQLNLLRNVSPFLRYQLLVAGQTNAAFGAIFNHYHLRSVGSKDPILKSIYNIIDNATSRLEDIPENLLNNSFQYIILYEPHRLADVLISLLASSFVGSNVLDRYYLHFAALQTFEINIIILGALGSALKYRSDNLSQLGLENEIFDTDALGTANTQVSSKLYSHFQTTITILASLSPHHPSVPTNTINTDRSYDLYSLLNDKRKLIHGLRSQLSPMAESLIALTDNDYKNGMGDRGWLVRYDGIIEKLISAGLSDEAIRILSQYNDVKNLALAEVASNADPTKLKPKIQSFRERFGDSEMIHMLRALTQFGQESVMLDLDSSYKEQVEMYLNGLGDGVLAIKYLAGLDQPDKVGPNLAELALSHVSIGPRKVFLALSKLEVYAYHPDWPRSHMLVDGMNIEGLDDELDLLMIHDQLQETVIDAITRNNPGCVDVGDQHIEQVIPTLLSSSMKSMKGLQFRFKQCIRKLMRGTILDLNELIDVLTIKCNELESSEESGFKANNGFELGLEALRRVDDTVSSDQFQIAKSTFWRRVLLFDNWEDLDKEAKANPNRSIHTLLYGTALYSLAVLAAGAGLDKSRLMPPPDQCYFLHSTDIEPALLKDLNLENEQLLNYINNYRLNSFFEQAIDTAEQEVYPQ